MDFVSKVCGRCEADPQRWLLGFELSKPDTRMKSSLVLLGRWDEQRAREPNALFFCSASCQDKYVATNYGDETLLA